MVTINQPFKQMKTIEREKKYKSDNKRFSKYLRDNPFIINKEILQGYLKTSKTEQVRVRVTLKGNLVSSEITVKYMNVDKYTNHEYTYNIPVDEAMDMISNCKNIIHKSRFSVFYDKLNLIVDVDTIHLPGKYFKNIHLAEVEFSDEKNLNVKKESLNLPFLGKEVTGNKKYSNLYISKRHRYGKKQKNDLITYIKERVAKRRVEEVSQPGGSGTDSERSESIEHRVQS